MTDEINTPRTDNLATRRAYAIGRGDLAVCWKEMHDHACQLERELTLVTQERDALRKELDEAYERAAQVCEDLIENSLSKECNTWTECSPNAVDGASRCTWAIRSLKTEVKS